MPPTTQDEDEDEDDDGSDMPPLDDGDDEPAGVDTSPKLEEID